jgi:hypothetical protein
MATIYDKAPQEVAEKAEALLGKFHFDITNYDVHIDFIFARSTLDDNGVPEGPALKHNGYPALGLAKIIGPKDRLMGRGDCEIVLDGDRWPNLSPEQQDALIDHELEHIQIKFDKHGAPVMDDLHRPKLKMKKHDHQFGWFDIIAKRHGSDSIEVNQFRELCEDESGQFYLPFLQLDTAKAELPDAIRQSVSRFKKILGPGNSATIKVAGQEPVTVNGE